MTELHIEVCDILAPWRGILITQILHVIATCIW